MIVFGCFRCRRRLALHDFILCVARDNKENCQTAKLKTSVAFTYFLYYTDPSLKIKLCVSQHVNDNEKIKIDKLKRLLNPTEVIRTANQILTLGEETEDN